MHIVPKLMSYLAFKEHDILAILGLAALPITEHETKSIILRWRHDAWRNAKKLRSGEINLNDLRIETDRLVQRIIWEWKEYLNPIHAFKLLRDLESLSVDI
ncbi:MAG: hypothetical protein Q9M91_00800 [Candidatus Dojkabacteria bacterium]|nr:hypothetical protein [Candidatus Dojkabacteria bacterium]MDQ7020366.1 hypothetical protein [Candidatus Dojkabacteria bacterium]